MNINKLKGKIVENEMNVASLAKEMGIDRATLYRKLNKKGETLTIKEANMIVDILDLTEQEAMEIFFNLIVAWCANKGVIKWAKQKSFRRSSGFL